MDVRTRIRNIIVVLVGIGITVLLIILLFRLIFGTGSQQKPIDIGKYANTSAVATLLMDGPTNLDQDHYQVQISVDATSSTIDIIQGYQGKVITSKTYPNNSSAYGAFLQSLKLLNFAKGKNINIDYRGYCPTGDRYLYSFSNNGTTLFKYWSTSCGGEGTFEGDAAGVRQLFEAQVPSNDLSELVNNTNVML